MIGKQSLGRWAAALLILCAATPEPLFSFETDQYLALDAEIADSVGVVNAYLNRELETFLNRPGVDRLGCRQIPPRFFRYLFRGLLASRLQKFLKSDPGIDLFPKGLSYREHLHRSVYRKPVFPYVLPLSPTIRIGEVRFGLDKFGHLFGFGRSYYKHYIRARARGVGEQEALREVILRGLRFERFFVGGPADGVVSYGDLEANYQGLRLARDFCEGSRPIVREEGGSWRPARWIDLREYVTPLFDESYNNNHYSPPRWKRVRPILVAEYCDRFFSPAVQARMRRYEAIERRPNPSKRVIAEYFEGKGRNPQQRQSMRSICEPPAISPVLVTASQ